MVGFSAFFWRLTHVKSILEQPVPVQQALAAAPGCEYRLAGRSVLAGSGERHHTSSR